VQLKSLEAGDVLFYLDIRNGETFASMPENYWVQAISDPVIYPLHYKEEGDHFDTISAFGNRKLGKQLKGACDYLEHAGLVFLTYHYPDQTGFTNELVIYDPKTGPLFEKMLNKGADGLASGTFFIVHEQLIFVEGKNRLYSYLIKN